MLDDTMDRRAAEDRIARDRDRLAASLDALAARMTMGNLLLDGVRLAGAAAVPCALAALRVARANPGGAALTLAGVAWLAFGRRRAPAPPPAEPLAGTGFEAVARWEDEGGPAMDPPDPEDDFLADPKGAGAVLEDARRLAADHPAAAALAAAAGGAVLAALVSGRGRAAG